MLGLLVELIKKRKREREIDWCNWVQATVTLLAVVFHLEEVTWQRGFSTAKATNGVVTSLFTGERIELKKLKSGEREREMRECRKYRKYRVTDSVGQLPHNTGPVDLSFSHFGHLSPVTQWQVTHFHSTCTCALLASFSLLFALFYYILFSSSLTHSVSHSLTESHIFSDTVHFVTWQFVGGKMRMQWSWRCFVASFSFSPLGVLCVSLSQLAAWMVPSIVAKEKSKIKVSAESAWQSGSWQNRELCECGQWNALLQPLVTMSQLEWKRERERERERKSQKRKRDLVPVWHKCTLTCLSIQVQI